MSQFSYDKIPFGVKSSNLSAVANFSSTMDDSYIFVIANNCNTPVYNNVNQYDNVYNSFNNAALYGVNIKTNTDNSKYHEAYIGIKKDSNIQKVAQFNTVNTTISANIIPSTDTSYNIGEATKKWNHLYSSYIHGDGSSITNVNLLDKTTSQLNEGSNLYYTDTRFDDRLLAKTLDNVRPGTSNKFIVNNNFNGNLNINGILSACNLVIEGETTTLNTTLYQTERFELFNQNTGPAFKITQVGSKDIFQIYQDSTSVFTIDSNRHVGINKSTPAYELDVVGTINATNLRGNASGVTNVNLSDKNTAHLTEDPNGTNLYYTPQRVGAICAASNIHTSNYVDKLASTLITTYIPEGTNRYYKEEYFNQSLATKTLDNIANGVQNRFIVNNKYIGSVEVTDTLTANEIYVKNRIVYDTNVNVIQQTVNQTEKTVITNLGAGPALKVVQNDPDHLYNVFEAYVGSNVSLSIIQNGYVGINKLAPAYNLDVDGTINATNLRGNASTVTNVNLSDKTTAHLTEDPNGTNLYYTPQRVGVIATASNVNTSNFVTGTSNLISINLNYTSNKIVVQILQNELNTCNYVKNTSNQITSHLLLNILNASNYVLSSSNYIANNNLISDLNSSNYVKSTCNFVQSTSNEIINHVLINENNTCNFVRNTSNQITNHVLNNESNTCNFVRNTSNQITNHVLNNESNTCNFVRNTSNQIMNHVLTNESNTCNFVRNTSNQITNHVLTNESNTCNFVRNTSNHITNHVLTNENNTCNFVQNTSNQITNHVLSNDFLTSNYITLTSNILISKFINNSNFISVVNSNLINLSTNNVAEGSNLFYTTARFDARLLTKTLDNIYQGTSNKFILNNNFNGNLNINGVLSAEAPRL